MDTVEVKTSELIGTALDWATAQAVDLPVEIGLECCGFGIQTSTGSPPECCGDPIAGVFWKAERRYQPSEEHSVKACRIIVASKFGETISIPSELMQ